MAVRAHITQSSIPLSIQEGLPPPHIATNNTTGLTSEVLVADATAVEEVIMAPPSQAPLTLKETTGKCGGYDTEEGEETGSSLAEVKALPVCTISFQSLRRLR